MRFLVLVAMLCLAAPAARAAVPSPVTSQVGTCLTVCPAGDLSFRVIVRDPAANPVPNSGVFLGLAGCPDVRLAPTPGPGLTWNPAFGYLTGFTNAQGIIDFQIQGGGICSSPIVVYADGVPLGTVPAFASVDQDGDLRVTQKDLRLIEGKLGTSDGGADFDCAAGVTEADVTLLRAHMRHKTPGLHGKPGVTTLDEE